MMHEWNMTPREAIALQRTLAGQVRVDPIGRAVRTIAGTDCAFVGRDTVLAVAVLCDARTLEVIAHGQDIRGCTFPYIPGLLSFREAPAIIAAIEKLPARPDLLMMDGQGQAHPRGLGIASHVGLLLDMPTIGVAKSRLCGQHRSVGVHRACRAALRLEGRTIGAVVRTRDNVSPLYVSVGHRVTLEQAIRWTVRCAIAARLPEPTRRAHQYVSRLKISDGLGRQKD